MSYVSAFCQTLGKMQCPDRTAGDALSSFLVVPDGRSAILLLKADLAQVGVRNIIGRNLLENLSKVSRGVIAVLRIELIHCKIFSGRIEARIDREGLFEFGVGRFHLSGLGKCDAEKIQHF